MTETEALRSEKMEHRTQLRLKDVRAIVQNIGNQIETQLEERPYVVLGATLATGFAAGSLFGSRVGQIAVAGIAGYFLRRAMREPDFLTERLASFAKRADVD